jgi:hypothetical protein
VYAAAVKSDPLAVQHAEVVGIKFLPIAFPSNLYLVALAAPATYAVEVCGILPDGSDVAVVGPVMIEDSVTEVSISALSLMTVNQIC